MATKKQKRQAASDRRDRYNAETERLGQAALQRAREYRKHKIEQAAYEANRRQQKFLGDVMKQIAGG